MIKLSAVSYTNTLPFIYGLQHAEIKNEIQLSLDIPSQCAQKLQSGLVDIGLIPVAAVLDLSEYHIISNYCIGANGAVNSVFIFSNYPIHEIEYLILDEESRTSNQLALVLLKNYWKLLPNIVQSNVSLSAKAKTAFIQIGDRTFGKSEQYQYAYDLAEAWKNFTTLPFVFAAWVSNKALPADFIARLNEAFKFGLLHRKEVISQLPSRNDFDLSDYLNHKIDYDLNAEKMEALHLFHRYISEL